MRVLVTGAGGQLGHDVVAVCTAEGDDVVALGRSELDVTERSDVAATVAAIRPDVVMHCAAWTAVDDCEGDPDRAFAVNADAVRWVREASELVGAHLLTISTDYVFDGTLDRPYHERDTPNPRSVYGRSKLAGEVEAGPASTIVRTSWVCGAHGTNMVRTVLRLAAELETLEFVDDQRGCPTFTSDLAPMLRRLALERRAGIHHVTNEGAVTWFEFVRAIVSAIGRDPAMVRPIRTADLVPARAAERPANGVLDNAVLREAGLPLLRDYRQPLAELVARLSA
ncbi:MAG TPA: dTDP-4-dehydrorhamnose reductase [Ilumatobacteraceae bacterium]|nr:dTDP-4-dehydrorhamnose reductase [Ilumatobacteraceae bacterium]